MAIIIALITIYHCIILPRRRVYDNSSEASANDYGNDMEVEVLGADNIEYDNASLNTEYDEASLGVSLNSTPVLGADNTGYDGVSRNTEYDDASINSGPTHTILIDDRE